MNKQDVIGKRLILNKGKIQIIVFEDQRIGQGGFGQCYLGMYQGTLVLIKRILRKNKSITEFRKDYEEEIKLIYEAARTRRKSEISNIVYVEPISLISSDNNHAYIIMEYCRGGSLSSLMAQRQKKNNWFTFEEFCTIFQQILQGYFQLYSVNILHRDLKPENIFIQNGLFKIGDFGLSYKSSSKDKKLRGGTLAYLAPEAFSETNKASDIYSLGILFYKLMHIEHPYYCSEEWKQFEKEKQKEVVLQLNKVLNQQTHEKLNHIHRNEYFRDFIRNRKVSKNSIIYITNGKKYKEELNILRNLILQMINFDYLKRPSIEEIMLKIQKLELPTCQFGNENDKLIPEKYQYSIKKQSSVFEASIHLNLKYYRQGKYDPPQIVQVREKLKKINLITISLFDIIYSIEMELRNKQNIYNFPRIIAELKNFNYNLTYHYYCEVMETIKNFQPDVLSFFYQTGQDYLLDNTKSNKEVLEQDVPYYLLLKKRSRMQSLKIIQQVFEEEIFKEKFMLDDQNVTLLKLLMIVYRMIKGIIQLTSEQAIKINQQGKELSMEICKARDQTTLLLESQPSFEVNCHQAYEELKSEGFRLSGILYY